MLLGKNHMLVGKNLILPGKNHDSTSKNYVVFGKTPWKHGIFSGVPRVKPVQDSETLESSSGSSMDFVRESSPNGPTVQVKYDNFPILYWLINDLWFIMV